MYIIYVHTKKTKKISFFIMVHAILIVNDTLTWCRTINIYFNRYMKGMEMGL